MFYFVHWLTDLAGAEPTPLRGCEKFVLGFPRPVFRRLIKSIPVVQRLAHTPPVPLYLEFLLDEWRTSTARVGELPSSTLHAIALMRLVMQAQAPTEQESVAAAFRLLEPADADTLADELALSGVAATVYEGLAADLARGPAFLGCMPTCGSNHRTAGPEPPHQPCSAATSALLCSAYSLTRLGPCGGADYSPAFLRKNAATADDARVALAVLADVYRAARQLWPSSQAQAGTGVTLMLEQLKAAALGAISSAYADGECWVLVRTGELSASVERHPMSRLASLLTRSEEGAAAVLLPLWRSACRAVQSPPYRRVSWQQEEPFTRLARVRPEGELYSVYRSHTT